MFIVVWLVGWICVIVSGLDVVLIRMVDFVLLSCLGVSGFVFVVGVVLSIFRDCLFIVVCVFGFGVMLWNCVYMVLSGRF